MKNAIHLATYLALGAAIAAPLFSAPVVPCVIASAVLTIMTGLFSVFG